MSVNGVEEIGEMPRVDDAGQRTLRLFPLTSRKIFPLYSGADLRRAFDAPSLPPRC